MKKLIIIAILNLSIISMWLVAYNKKPDEVRKNVDITVETPASQDSVYEIQDALSVMPSEVVNAFVDNDWKIVLLSELSSSSTSECSSNSLVGLINFSQKTISIKEISGFEGAVKNIAVHELCHFADRYYGNLSGTEDFKKIFELNKDSYVPFSYAGIEETENTENDLSYSTSTEMELFAEAYKDYLLHNSYLKENYHELYFYFKNLEVNGI